MKILRTIKLPGLWALHSYYTLPPWAPDNSGRLLLADSTPEGVAEGGGEPASPFISLAVTAILYAVFLGWFRHKYGG